jgi:hypothetical protein
MAGAAVYEADASLKTLVTVYADKVQQAMLLNPFDLGNDTLFEDWKKVARLSQAMEQLEIELRKIFAAVQELNAGGGSTRQNLIHLPPPSIFPTPNGPAEALRIATDIAVKRSRKKSIEKRSELEKPQRIKGNTARLLAQLKTVLNAEKFSKISRTELGVAAGLPKGSIGASFAKLFEAGYLRENEQGSLCLIANQD